MSCGASCGTVTLCVTLSAHLPGHRPQGQEALPSLRYLTLIRDGAADYGLDPAYQAWLAGLRHYQAESTGQQVGRRGVLPRSRRQQGVATQVRACC